MLDKKIEEAKKESFWSKIKRQGKVLSLWGLGLITGICFCYVYLNWHTLYETREVIIQVSHAQTTENIEKPKTNLDIVNEIAENIYNKESSRGKNNYSKCQAIGKVNSIGFNIPGNGSYQCFDSHEDEMVVLRGWIMDKLARGWETNLIYCYYNTGKKVQDCGYIK